MKIQGQDKDSRCMNEQDQATINRDRLGVVVVVEADGVLGLVEERLVRLVIASDLVTKLLRV